MIERQEGLPRKKLETKKVSFNFPVDELYAIRREADLNGQTMTEFLRDAIARELFLRKRTAEGDKIILRGRDGKDIEIITRQDIAVRARSEYGSNDQ